MTGKPEFGSEIMVYNIISVTPRRYIKKKSNRQNHQYSPVCVFSIKDREEKHI